ncbi:hypothetical protein QLG10_23250 [Pseudomonas sp. V98_8]|uniref:hypothetical protein n=1 Tax=Pseudomonas sp. V98_8 TaxID=3044228 RepID=UPI00249F866E|nr:hypothetical protein [Pseudomonas sp. V98_8]MDI3395353.1 hypothetical protein [Pseudomonas sp. V98_8]
MDNSTLWLEVSKSNGAILSYVLEQPTTASDKVDYVQATKDELTYLSALEDAVFAPGMVATVRDLQEHRARVNAAIKAKATPPTKSASKAPEQPTKGDSKTSSTNPKTNNENAKASLISALRKYRSRK